MIDFPPTKPVITNTRLNQYAPFVHRLSFSGPFLPEYYTIKFPRLRTLDFNYDCNYHAPCNNKYEIDRDLDAAMIAGDNTNKTNFIRLNPTMKDLRRHWSTPTPCRLLGRYLDNTTRLVVAGLMNTHGDKLDAFWKACDLLEELNIIATAMGCTSALLQPSFPRLKRVSLDAFCLDF
ncbi:hypothetical protein EC957_011534 [Mortierella hygrophila]|uniref:Uncharacterized protein n=1 Tax=Mortierella hygrophila TaxID=979708 RepID=A0A9P6F945_9FUNG|nr:hypothetical protein EC957_011534 [Mortierella hygrophila]